MFQFARGGGLRMVGVRPVLSGHLPFRRTAGASENDDDEGVEFGPLPKPAQDFPAALAGHIRIEQKQVWHWIFLPICKLPFATEIVDCLLSVVKHLEPVL